MSDNIVVQLLTVSYYRDPRGREMLKYSPSPLEMTEEARETVFRPVRWRAVEESLDAVRDEVADLLQRASVGQTIGDNHFSAVSRMLAGQVLPDEGFVRLLTHGTHPQFDVVRDPACQIPWEMLTEHCVQCPKCHRVEIVPSSQLAPGFCSKDGSAMEPSGGPLALSYHLNHLSRGSSSCAVGGREFLFIEDPTGDLCRIDNDPTRACRDHLSRLHEIVEQQGFALNVLSLTNATRVAVRDAMANGNVAGIYYFGHGYLPRQGDEGCLRLADGPLSAGEIKEIDPSARFVFINACMGAGVPDNWDVEAQPCSVADAFARSTQKVVIAPICPIINVQAAEAALEFFNKSSAGMSLGEAMRHVRQRSHSQYLKGHPHLSWMAYRYLGDPNRMLPSPMAVPPSPDTVQPPRRCRIFGDDGDIDLDAFSFDISGVLLRAAKRRNNQDRQRITFQDFLAGLIRKGDLTRFLLRQLNVNPDDAYEQLGETVEVEPAPYVSDQPGVSSDAGTQAGNDGVKGVSHPLERWIIRRRDEFSEELIDCLCDADRMAQEQAGDCVTEQAVLDAMSRAKAWDAVPGMPVADRLGAKLSDRSEGPLVDPDGCLVLDGLTPQARAVIEAAHVLAQQRGVKPITHRLTLAALLSDRRGFAARAFEAAHLEPKLTFTLMVAASDEGMSGSFGLSPEACSRIILPVLEEARKTADAQAAGREITDEDLFRAFCRRADRGFKQMLKTSELKVDLDTLGQWVEGSGEGPLPDSEHRSKGDIDASDINADVLDEAGWKVVQDARRIAMSRGEDIVCSVGLFTALVRDDTGSVAETCAALGLPSPNVLRIALAQVFPRRVDSSEAAKMTFTPHTQEILVRAIGVAKAKGRRRATPGDITTAFFVDGGGVIGELIRQMGLTVPRLVTVGGLPEQAVHPRRSVLDAFGRDLTQCASAGALPNIVGRDREMDQILQALLLTANANTLLIGEAGVGKTAIVEGVAHRIVEGHCTPRLRSMRVVELTAGALVANTRYRGEFEQRMQEVLAEARDDVILFIDEIHTIVGAGSGGSGSLDATNMLKSALASRDIRLIGATTPAECRRIIARDRALSRRFQIQNIDPPSRDHTLEILQAWQGRLESHHQVCITADALAAAVDLSERYIIEKRWPASARDILDQSCALVSGAATEDCSERAHVTSEHVAKVVSASTGIPLQHVAVDQNEALRDIEERLSRHIVGQEHAVGVLAQAVRRACYDLGATNRPRGVFLFIGPPGVGKTELSKMLAQEVYGGADGLIRYDMGDFTEPHSTAKLLGAPPSYVGYGEGAPLVERLRRRPYAVVLFDEIGHAHPNVLASLLRLLSEGTIEDVEGNVGDARNAIIIMTANIGDAEWSGGFGFARTEGESGQVAERESRAVAERFLPSKIVDRADAIVRFWPLSEESLTAIAALRTDEIIRRARIGRRLTVEVMPDVLKHLAQTVANGDSGARDMHRAVDTAIQTPLGDFLSSVDPGSAAKVRVVVRDGVIVVETAHD